MRRRKKKAPGDGPPKKKKAKAWVLHTALRDVLRGAYRWAPMRKQALARAHVGLGMWLCEICRMATKEPEVDHIIPVGSPPGSKHALPDATWDAFINRLFCPPEGLAVLCSACHRTKTNTQLELLTQLHKS